MVIVVVSFVMVVLMDLVPFDVLGVVGVVYVAFVMSLHGRFGFVQQNLLAFGLFNSDKYTNITIEMIIKTMWLHYLTMNNSFISIEESNF